jgi:hypothetical protein
MVDMTYMVVLSIFVESVRVEFLDKFLFDVPPQGRMTTEFIVYLFFYGVSLYCTRMTS